MLTITPDAAQAIDGILAASEISEGGLRISSEVAQDESGTRRIDLHLSLVESPEEGDQLAEGGNVFIQSETAPLLDDKLLDAEVEENEVQFTLRDQFSPPSVDGRPPA